LSVRIRAYIREQVPLIETSLDRLLPQSRFESAVRLNEAIRHAATTGGRRLRPVLTLLTAQLCRGALEQALPVACGVEFVHAASLVVDDLPVFDNALVRRGSPAVHAMFGQDFAILAALALLNQAYALFANVEGLVAEAARAIGCDGMIGGQAADVVGASHPDRVSKTAALVRLAVIAGAMTAGARLAEITVLSYYGEQVGTVYQICDDLMDEISHAVHTGKPARQDVRNRRATYVTELGIEGARRRAFDLAECAKAALRKQFGPLTEVELLAEWVDLILEKSREAAMG
jgi:geranylgeranyl diphosphate synthase type II